jgi:hypothetical protein
VLSLDTVYADTYDDPMLTARDRRRNDQLNAAPNPNPGVLNGAMPKKNETLPRKAPKQKKAKPTPTPSSSKQSVKNR